MAKEQNVSKNFTFKYVKVNQFKTFHIDGIFGGLNVRRDVVMNFFIETIEIPNNTTHVINQDRSIGAQLPLEQKPHFGVREAQLGVTFDLNTAKSMVIWLNEKIAAAEKQPETSEIQNKKELS